MNNNIVIGKKLKQLREGRKLTQSQISDIVGLSRASICNIERGYRAISVKDLKVLANYYDVDMNFFYEDEASKNEVISLLERAKELFKNPALNEKDKDQLYQEIMRLYLAAKDDNK